MTAENPYPPPHRSVADALAALDARHGAGELSDEELEFERAAIVQGLGPLPRTAPGDDAAAPTRQIPVTPPPPPPAAAVDSRSTTQIPGTRTPPWGPGDTQPAAKVSPRPLQESGPHGGGRPRARLLLLGGLAALVCGIAGGLLASALTPKDSEPAVLLLPPGPSAAYRQAAASDLTATLRRSARVLGRRLRNSGQSEDIVPLIRLAGAQVPLLRGAQRAANGLPVGRIDSQVHADLRAGVASHLAMVEGLARLDAARPTRALEALGPIQEAASAAAVRYGDAYEPMRLASPVDGSGLLSLGGLRNGLEDLRAQLVERFTPPPIAPVISFVGGSDVGFDIEVTISYCDRSPGGSQDFTYYATITDGSGTTRGADITLSQATACSDVTLNVADNFLIGEEASIQAQVVNLTTGLSAEGTGSALVVD